MNPSKYLLPLAAMCLLLGCQKEPVHVTAINVEPTSLELTVGDRSHLSATVEPADADDKTFTWTSSDKKVVVIDADGDAVALAAGSATIKAVAADGGIEGSCRVTVKVKEEPVVKTTPVTSIKLDKTSLEIATGGFYNLHATVEPEDATDKSLEWSSSNEDVVTVNKNGRAVGFGTGSAVVTVSSVSNPEVKATCEFKVTSEVVSVTGITIYTSSTKLYIGTPQQLDAVIKPNNATDQNITWKSSNQSVATVSETGLVTPLAVGSVVVSATTHDGGKTDQVTLTVYDTQLTSFTFAEYSAEPIVVHDGTTFQLTPVILPEDASNKKVSWSTSDKNIAQVNANGLVTFYSTNGSVSITGTTAVGSLTCRQAFKVEVQPREITIPAELTVNKGGSTTVKPKILPDNTFNKEVGFSTDNASIATVSDDGQVTGVSTGTTTLRAWCQADPSVKAECKVTVIADNVVAVNGVQVTYKTGDLESALTVKTVTSLKWTEPSLMNVKDLAALQTTKETLVEIDASKLNFVDDGQTYAGYTSNVLKMKLNVLPEEMFAGFHCLKKAILPQTLTEIAAQGFSSCTALEECLLPSSLKTIGRYAFSGCKSLKGIELPEGFERFTSDSAFQGCTSLTSFTFPSTCMDTNSETLRQCTSLETITFKGNTYISASLTSGCYNIKKLVLEPAVTDYIIVDGCIVTADGKTLILMPTYFPDTHFVVPGIEVVFVSFSNDAPYTTLEYSEGTVSMNNGLYYCQNLLSITYPSTIETIKTQVYTLPKLTELTVKATTPPYIYNNFLGNFPKLEAIRVPAASVKAYKDHAVWGEYGHLIVPME